MRWDDVQFQARAAALLQRGLANGRTPHAYLLTGPEGVGKELAATAVAAALMCGRRAEGDFAACGTCDSCRLLGAGNHPDFQIVHRGLRKFHPERTIRASKGLFLVVDLIRHFLIEPASRAPSVGARKVYIIRDAERMNEEAQNALLKTLEEPPARTTLILVTASAGRLLPTIRSRCAVIEFDRLPDDFVAQQLGERTKLDSEDVEALAALSDGQLGVALRWAKLGLSELLPELAGARALTRAPELFGKQLVEAAGAIAANLAAGDADDAELETEEVDEEGDDGGEESRPTTKSRSGKAPPTDLVREGFRLALRGLAHFERRDFRARLTRDADAAADDFEPVEARFRAVQQAEWMLDRNVAPQLVGEALAVAWARP